MEVKLFVVFYLVCVRYTSSFMTGVAQQQVIYITTDPLKCPCPSKPCLTLAQFAEKLDQVVKLDTELILLQGNHTLDLNIEIKNISRFTVQSNSTYTQSQITCKDNETSLRFENIGEVWIKGLKFVGCGNNRALVVHQLTIKNITFLGQNKSGTAIELVETNASILHSRFYYNVVGTCRHNLTVPQYSGAGPPLVTVDSVYVGGALIATHSNVRVENCVFERNHAENLGGAIFIESGSKVTLFDASFSANWVCVKYNQEPCFGSVVYADGKVNGNKSDNSQVIIIKSNFSFNQASRGVVVTSLDSAIDISCSNFVKNHIYPAMEKRGEASGGILELHGHSPLSINNSVFYNNTARWLIFGGPLVILQSTQFLNNIGWFGGVLYVDSTNVSNCHVTIKRCQFSNTSAFQGGVVNARLCNITIQDSSFDGNTVNSGHPDTQKISGTPMGGVVSLSNSYISISKCNFQGNTAVYGVGGVLELARNVKLTIHSCTFVNNEAVSGSGGAIYATQSNIVFTGENRVIGNSAGITGGAIVAYEDTTVYVYDEVLIGNNSAGESGGGVFLYQSKLRCHSNCKLRFEGNKAAVKGGGVYAITSVISVLTERTSNNPSSVYFIENEAQLGGGVHLELASGLEVIKSGEFFYHTIHNLHFIANSADYGGALFVADGTNFNTCSFNNTGTKCFLQILITDLVANTTFGTDTIDFDGNMAREQGSVLYGGLLDRCTLDGRFEYVDARADRSTAVNGFTYFKNVSRLHGNEGISVSSKPVRVCLCNSDGEHDCGMTPPTIHIKKGGNFTLPLVAVDQVNQTVANTTIFALLKYSESGLNVGQLTQTTGDMCTSLNFNVYSPHPTENLKLYADGPCRNADKSLLKVPILFKECTCPVGFQEKASRNNDSCVCDCDPQLLGYITSCDPQDQTLTRKGNSWISFLNVTINDTHQYNYLTYPYCPLDYCVSPHVTVKINLTTQDGSDTQCANNRSGILCGVCHPGLSISLGSSHCIRCEGFTNLWWVVLLFLTAGILLVVILLMLNLTVAEGTINGIVFYAHIIGATSSTFFSSLSTKPAYIGVSWLYLELGFDACFYNGLDTYVKTWLEMAFPTYIIILLVIIIEWSDRSLKFSSLILRKKPVATLATMILLSYTKFLSVVITTLSYVTLQYPDGPHKTVWLPDASVGYWSGKHIGLFVVALLILLVGGVYTFFLLSWQWLTKCPCSLPPKLRYFIESYQGPYKLEHRYWTGLLLLARVVLYLVFSFNTSGDPGVNLIGIIIVMCSLLLLKAVCGHVYKNWKIDTLETTCFLNITVFSAAQLFNLQSGRDNAVSTFVSVFITAVMVLMVVFYHMYVEIISKSCKKYTSTAGSNDHRNRQLNNDYDPIAVAPPFTTDVIEFPISEDESDEEDNQTSNNQPRERNSIDSTPLLDMK